MVRQQGIWYNRLRAQPAGTPSNVVQQHVQPNHEATMRKAARMLRQRNMWLARSMRRVRLRRGGTECAC